MEQNEQTQDADAMQASLSYLWHRGCISTTIRYMGGLGGSEPPAPQVSAEGLSRRQCNTLEQKPFDISRRSHPVKFFLLTSHFTCFSYPADTIRHQFGIFRMLPKIQYIFGRCDVFSSSLIRPNDSFAVKNVRTVVTEHWGVFYVVLTVRYIYNYTQLQQLESWRPGGRRSCSSTANTPSTD